MAYPENYRNILGSAENTEKAIKYVKDMFQENLSAQLTLLRVWSFCQGPGSTMTSTVSRGLCASLSRALEMLALRSYIPWLNGRG